MSDDDLRVTSLELRTEDGFPFDDDAASYCVIATCTEAGFKALQDAWESRELFAVTFAGRNYVGTVRGNVTAEAVSENLIEVKFTLFE
ncbi:hypothetical protein KJZ99_04160 [bacterium]|nr:hypothetical protein [bacterium]